MAPKGRPSPETSGKGSESHGSHIFDKETVETFAQIQAGLRGETAQTADRPRDDHPEESAD